MKKGLPSILFYPAVFLLMLSVAACGSNEADDSEANSIPSKAVEKSIEENSPQTSEALADKSAQTAPESAVPQALKAMAASEGIYWDEIPEDFPVSIVPPFPGGEIQQASMDDNGEATLLQLLPVGKDEALEHYSKFYDDLGWKSDDPMTIMGRTLLSFTRKGSNVDMTLIDRDGGKTFVALAYH